MFPLLAECAKTVGAWPLRQRATLAGNVCNASPAADTAVALLALDAVVNVATAGGRLAMAISELFLGPGQTALMPGDLVTEVVLPGTAAGFRGCVFDKDNTLTGRWGDGPEAQCVCP